MKSKTLLLSLFFAFAVVGLKAQEVKQETKYEYAAIRQGSGLGGTVIYISVEGQPIETKKVPVKDYYYFDNKFLFEEVAKLQDEGWRVFNVSEGNGGISIVTFFLRRKK